MDVKAKILCDKGIIAVLPNYGNGRKSLPFLFYESHLEFEYEFDASCVNRLTGKIHMTRSVEGGVENRWLEVGGVGEAAEVCQKEVGTRWGYDRTIW